MKIRNMIGTCAALTLTGALAVSCCFLPPKEETLDLSGMTLVFSNEFDTAADLNDWEQVAVDKPANNEAQKYYSSGYAKIVDSPDAEDGKALQITAEKVSGQWKSARLHGKKGFKYGYFEARLKMPVAYKGSNLMESNSGVWPAFWMMPKDSVYGGWPRSGEIDIMEYSPGKSGESTYATVHYGVDATAANHKYTSVGKNTFDDPVSDYHTYGCMWKSGGIEMFYDGESLGSFYANPGKAADKNWMTFPFDQEFYMILNLAMGGDLGGSIADGMTKAVYEIDYVRVYQ